MSPEVIKKLTQSATKRVDAALSGHVMEINREIDEREARAKAKMALQQTVSSREASVEMNSIGASLDDSDEVVLTERKTTLQDTSLDGIKDVI